ncbi:MAG TPA: hypothetical protein VM328_10720 [Fimbriimonadaceae bacterium]|nr:hypothetical protein [Fimbriimonadaceae bacterium]
MRRLILLVTASLAWGCSKGPSPEQPPVRVTLPQGTEVRLLLLAQLEAGQAKVGDRVPFVVAEDVVVDGRTLISAGAPASGEVVWSRSEGTLSALANQPARLAVKLTEVEMATGAKARLETDGDAYQFTRANTGGGTTGRVIEDLMRDPDRRQVLEQLAGMFESGSSADLSSPEAREVLQALAAEMNLPRTLELVRRQEMERAESLIARIKEGGSAAAILGGSHLATVAAVGELARLADDVGSRLGRMLRGRTIKAHVGTPVTARVAEDMAITLPAR